MTFLRCSCFVTVFDLKQKKLSKKKKDDKNYPCLYRRRIHFEFFVNTSKRWPLLVNSRDNYKIKQGDTFR